MSELYRQLIKWICMVSEDVMKSRELFLLNDCDLTYTARNNLGLMLIKNTAMNIWTLHLR